MGKKRMPSVNEQIYMLIAKGMKRTVIARDAGITPATFRKRLEDNKWKPVQLMRLKLCGHIQWTVPRQYNAKALRHAAENGLGKYTQAA
jgi:DNA-binding Xre family transcriptional regulator